MNIVLQTESHSLVSFTTEEWVGICNSLSEVCQKVDVEDSKFEIRIGVSRTFLENLLRQTQAGTRHKALRTYSRADAWSDGASVQAICVTVNGDPADMSTEEARVFMVQLGNAIGEAEE